MVHYSTPSYAGVDIYLFQAAGRALVDPGGQHCLLVKRRRRLYTGSSHTTAPGTNRCKGSSRSMKVTIAAHVVMVRFLHFTDV